MLLYTLSKRREPLRAHTSSAPKKNLCGIATQCKNRKISRRPMQMNMLDEPFRCVGNIDFLKGNLCCVEKHEREGWVKVRICCIAFLFVM
jgi:hypothetical protein